MATIFMFGQLVRILSTTLLMGSRGMLLSPSSPFDIGCHKRVLRTTASQYGEKQREPRFAKMVTGISPAETHPCLVGSIREWTLDDGRRQRQDKKIHRLRFNARPSEDFYSHVRFGVNHHNYNSR